MEEDEKLESVEAPVKKPKKERKDPRSRQIKRIKIWLIMLGVMFAIFAGLIIIYPYRAQKSLGFLKLKQCPEHIVTLTAGKPQDIKPDTPSREAYIFKGEIYEKTEFDNGWVDKNCNLKH